ncbi:MAG: tRNA lysidine(34) synthetase TilS [Prevotellaceae bacterium]|nr:tRNA lysidine(34) synthetase TilS [Prevotellaceae bacterium]
MIIKLRKYITTNNLFNPEDKVLIGVSGGVDSMVLLHALANAGYSVAIAHCNFQLRGDESDRDEAFVISYAKEKGLTCFVKRFDTQEHAEKNGISIQMAARELRYAWFEELKEKNGFARVAIAHNANDTVETFFLNLTRGTGIKGLTGISVQSGDIVRPILFASRNEILEYAKLNKIRYREDSSNASDKYGRNRIRHNVIPELEQINPSFLHTMQENLQRMETYRDMLTTQVEELKMKVCVEEQGGYKILLDKMPEDNVDFWLYEILNPFGFSGSVVMEIVLSLNGESGKQFFSTTHMLLKDRNSLIIKKRAEVEELLLLVEENSIPMALVVDNASLHLDVADAKEIDFSKGSSYAFFDYEKLEFPLIIRRWKQGDTFMPLGMKGMKKLSDFFVDAKMTLFDKQEQLLLFSGDKIAWVIGRRTDERFKISPETTKVLRVRYR